MIFVAFDENSSVSLIIVQTSAITEYNQSQSLLSLQCVKSVRIRSYFGQHFPVFSPNAGKYGPE